MKTNEMPMTLPNQEAKKADRGNLVKTLTPFLGIIIVFVLFSVSTGGKFIAISNLQLIVLQSVITIVGGIGTTFVMSHGNLDFSQGGTVALSAVAGYFASTVNPALVLPVCIMVGVLCSSAVAVVHIVCRVPAFIVGLCIMFIGRGVAGAMFEKTSMIAPASFMDLDNIQFFAIVLIVTFVVAYIIFDYTKVGKYNRAIGSNERAARLSGVPVNLYKYLAFLISGITLGLCAFLSMIRAGGVTGNTGSMFETDILIALVLGGMSISGGSSSKMRSIVIGAFILMMLGNGLILWGVDPNLINAVRGIVFLAAVVLTYDRSSNQMVS